MYIEHRKPYQKSVSLRNEIDLLLHFPFGGLTGGELLAHTKVPAGSHKISGNDKPNRLKRSKKYH